VVITDKPVYSVENHPADSRVNLDESGKVQTLTSRMGTGGGNVPMVMETVYCLQDKSIGRKEANSCHGMGVSDETSYTLTGIDRHAVAYCTDVGWLNTEEDTSPTLLARMHKDPHLVSYWDGGQTAGTLTANNAGGNQRMPDKENFNAVIENRPHRYIVRRLTPTECARLQGFPDKWGHPDIKEKFTKEEYEFWLDVRNTHAIINGKTTKQYTKEQMLSWYNKLHTDAAEYKMWGNGIALPTALYVLQGIAEAVQ
jgi:DNA (cytosine-5)-methyltransferase 1